MEQKEIAIQCLEKLHIYKPYVNKFKSKAGIPCFFENFGGFYVDQEPELYDKIKEVEKENNCLVYAVTHEFINGDECWSMLCVTDDTSLDDLIMDSRDNCYYVFSYVWNKTTEYFSEFGDVFVKSFGGGIKRLY
jgi:hypothetical protein